MKIAIDQEVKELIRKAQELHSKDGKPATLYRLQEIYGVSRQTLKNWAERPNKELKQLAEFVEAVRKDCDLKEQTAYRLSIKANTGEE